MNKLIVTNGDLAASLMKEAGFNAEILPWRDVLHEGMVTDTPTLESLSTIRIDYLSQNTNCDRSQIESGFKERDRTMRSLERFDSVELWFERDLYDRLQLLQILAFLADNPVKTPVYLVESFDYLSELSHDELNQLKHQIQVVSSEQLDYARLLWRIFTSDTPLKLNDYKSGKAPILYTSQAIFRLLQEFPHVSHGLTLTQYRALNILHKQPQTIGRLFHQIQLLENVKFMGDTVFACYIETLAFVPQPLVTGIDKSLNDFSEDYQDFFRQEIQLTPVGQNVRSQTASHIELNGIDRWIGGTHLTPDNLYSWDETKELLIQI